MGSDLALQSWSVTPGALPVNPFGQPHRCLESFASGDWSTVNTGG